MSDYDYGNARLRAMKSRLLTRTEIEALAHTGSLSALINSLIRTPYRKSVEAAMVRTIGLNCIAEALRLDMIETLGNVCTFYGGSAREMVAIALRAYDVHNLKTILRGLSKQVKPDAFAAALLPVGELTPALLTRLVRASGPRDCIDVMASMRLPMAQPLLKLRSRRPGAGVFEMELALEQWHFSRAFDYVERSTRSLALFNAALVLEADICNLLIALRFVHAPAERQVLRKRLGTDGLGQLFVRCGRLSHELLTRIGQQDSLEDAVNTLAGTPYEPPLRAGLDTCVRSGRLSEFEKQLRCFRLGWMTRLIIKDPLGIGVPLGFFALKTSEAANVRWIARGISLGLEADTIKVELEFAK
jgi:V/A-type H+-transporting ATPase subunit C